MKGTKDADFRIDFIGIGAAKTGTRWLANVMREHSEIFFPKEKELFYFNDVYFEYDLPQKNKRHQESLSWYHDFFKAAKTNQLKGEICNQYMSSQNTAKAIFEYNPNVKIFAILRQPVERAISHYLYDKYRHFSVPQNFEEAIEKRPFYMEQGLYYQHLKPYFELFPKENIKIFLFEDLKKDKKAFFAELLQFLNAKEEYPENFEHQANVTAQPKIKGLNRFIDFFRYAIKKYNLEFVLPLLRKTGIAGTAEYIRDTINRTKVKEKIEIDEKVKNKMYDFFKNDIEQLEQLIHRDLSSWKVSKNKKAKEFAN